jgi:hydroxymethylbilane synthase
VQAEWVRNQLQQLMPETNISIKKIRTTGDKNLDTLLDRIDSKSVFTKEVEEALLEGEIDLAVHSMKDIATKMPEGLVIGAIPLRKEVGDSLISRSGRGLNDLPKGVKIGTSSLRRKAHLLYYRADLKIVELRGNLDTRWQKLMADNDIDAIVVSTAGLIRLGWEHRITEHIPMEIMLPAAGQGAIGIQIRKDYSKIADLIRPLDHFETHQCIIAERTFLEYLGGGCRVPISGYGNISGKNLNLEGAVASPDGKKLIRTFFTGEISEPEEIGKQLAEKIIKLGAREILEWEKRK